MTATHPSPRLALLADTAAGLMTPNPVSIRSTATVREAVDLLLDRNVHAAPVIDEAGRPVGVISQTDVLIHDRATSEDHKVVPDYFQHGELTLHSGEKLRGFEVVDVDGTTVADIMTPAVFSVPENLPAERVVEDMLQLRVHRLFVVDRAGCLVGVVSAGDVLRALRRV